ncbi:MAG TPA: hypothetical protein VNT77_08870 [Allosphingosinicella sp.]|nr:hypothetical protein [Allosphingosinicella sp.]
MADLQTSAPQMPDEKESGQKQDGRLNPIMAAALVGGTMAAAAGAYFGTRAIARRNRGEDGRPLNSVMATAITACDLSHKKKASEPPAPTEPKVPAEPGF